jgi:hypothetical protein
MVTNTQDQMERWREYLIEIINRDILSTERKKIKMTMM